MALPKRIEAAKAKTAKVVDHLLYLIELHENNALILYSPLLALTNSNFPCGKRLHTYSIMACISLRSCGYARSGTVSTLRKRMCRRSLS